MSACRRKKIDTYFPCTKLKSKKIKDIKMDIVINECIHLMNESVGNSLESIGIGNKFLNRTPMAHALRSTIDKWDLMQLKNFYKAKDTVSRTKHQPTYW